MTVEALVKLRLILQWLVLILYAILALGWISYSLILFSYNTFIIADPAYVSNGLAAFAGAFAAFILLLFERLFARIYTRLIRHRNALVKLEHSLNKYGEIIQTNVSLLDQFAATLTAGQSFITSFRVIPTDESVLLELRNTDLINDYFGLSLDYERMNLDYGTLSKSYDQNRKAVYDGKITIRDFQTHVASQVVQEIKLLKSFSESALKDTEMTLAKVRVLLRGKGILDLLAKTLSLAQKYPPSMAGEVEREIQTIRAEQARTEEASRARLAEMQKSLGVT